jgi:hypothetical protein
MPLQIHYMAIALNLLAGAGLLVLLGIHTSVSWRVVRTRATTQHYLLTGTRQRLITASWVVLSAFVATTIYSEVNSALMNLPHAWQLTTTENRGYVLLALGGYLAIGQILLGLSALSNGPRRRSATRSRSATHSRSAKRDRARRDGGSDLAAALASTVILAATVFAVMAMATIGYLQLLAHFTT